MNRYANESTCKILIGNKCDMSAERQVSVLESANRRRIFPQIQGIGTVLVSHKTVSESGETLPVIICLYEEDIYVLGQGRRRLVVYQVSTIHSTFFF